jgi:hypothetical protein
VSAVHLDRDGRARCGSHGARQLTADETQVTCTRCLAIMNGTYGVGNRQPDQPCGTLAAYRRHYRNGSKPCRSCLQARARYRIDRRAS